jgi:hypothetical protein
MNDLIDNIKRKSTITKSSKVKKDVEKDINIMQIKLAKLSRQEKAKSRYSDNYLSEEYLESIKSGNDHLNGKEKINRIDADSYGPNWYKLSIDDKETKLMDYFDDLNDDLFEDKELAIAEAMSRLHDNKLNTSKDVKYDRVNQRVIKLLDLKLDMTVKKFIWLEKKVKKERPDWMKKMLKKR